MTTAIVCVALLGLLIFVLGFGVSLTRGRSQTVIGYDPSPTDRLHKMVRAHGNSSEYAPMLAVLILLLGSQNPANWVLWVGGIATASRYLHAAGMLMGPSLDQVQPLRFVGALGTYLGGLALCVAVFMS